MLAGKSSEESMKNIGFHKTEGWSNRHRIMRCYHKFTFCTLLFLLLPSKTPAKQRSLVGANTVFNLQAGRWRSWDKMLGMRLLPKRFSFKKVLLHEEGKCSFHNVTRLQQTLEFYLYEKEKYNEDCYILLLPGSTAEKLLLWNGRVEIGEKYIYKGSCQQEW